MRRRSSLLLALPGALACALGFLALLLAAGAPAAAARQGDRDCGEFADQAAAQRFFVSHGGSPAYNFDDLDGNGDGIACNELPCPCSRAEGGGEAAAAVPPGHRIAARVTHVTDGDTVDVTFASGASLAVRLIGIDTPEEYRPGTPVECGARAAARSMVALAEGAHVTLITDPTQARFDRYGRLLAYVERGHRDLGKAQVRRGWAMPYVYEEEPFARLGAYRSAEAAAQREGLGAWGSCGGDFHSAEPGVQD